MYKRVEATETRRKRGEDSHESTPTALRIDLLEALFLLSLQPVVSPCIFAIMDSGTYLVDNAESSHE